MPWRIPLSDVRLSPRQKDAASKVIESGWLSMGPRTAAFEEAFAAHCHVPTEGAVAVSSGTAALVLALQALGIGPGDEVLVPSLTFVADANAVVALGATPVFVDVTAASRPLVDPAGILATVTPRTRAVIVVHYAGNLVDIAPLDALRARGISIVEDAAHAVGPIDDEGRWLPLAADIAAFSFFANKNLAVGEGGMVTTRDLDLARRVRLLRSHGMTTGTWDRHHGHASDYDVVVAGWNFRMNELAAALGEAGLDDLIGQNHERRTALRTYRDALGPAIELVCDVDDPTTGHIAVAVLPSGCRPAVREALAARGIQSSFHYPPIHRFAAYAGATHRSLPYTEEAADRLVTLPLHPWLQASEIHEIAETVLGAISSP